MKVGDELKIKGNLGFLTNPTMVVLAVEDDLVKLESVESVNRKLMNTYTDGLLSSLNASWYGKEIINSKMI